MRSCPNCNKSLPDDATICIGCGRPIAGRKAPPAPPAPPGEQKSIRPVPAPSARATVPANPTSPARPTSPQDRNTKAPPPPPRPIKSPISSTPAQPSAPKSSFAPSGSATTASPRKPPPPGPVTGPIAGVDDLQQKARLLEQRVKLARLRSWLLAGATAAALLIGAGVGYAYYTASVLSFARLKADIRIERNPLDPDRLTLFYRPVSAGKVGFRRLDKNRETELLDRVTPGGDDERFEWRWSGVQVGEVVKVTFRDGWSLTTKELLIPEAPPAPPLGDAALVGEVVNATDNQPVADADVRLVGTVLKAKTDAQGGFRLNEAPAGPASIEVSAPNFSIEQFEHDLVSGEQTPVRVVLSPGMQAGQIRIVLTWGQEPSDLDAHLEGPLPDEKRFHVFHKQRGDLKSKEFVTLDVDDRDGEGPETITVLGVLPGTYRFFVHHAGTDNDPSADERALARAGAEVKIYQGGQTYRFRTNNESPGNIWRVCDIEVSARSAATVQRIDTYEFATAEEEGVYAKRTRGNRQEWIGAYGGTPGSEAAVEAGLNWLARHQAEDGHWGPDCLARGSQSRCEEDHRCTDPGSAYEMAQTGLAVLAFQAGGHYSYNNSKYSDVVRRGLDWLAEHQHQDGALVTPLQSPRHGYYMYEHGIATFALAEACAVAIAAHREPDERYRSAAEKAVHFIDDQQHNDGGWRYTEQRGEESDTSVSGWQVLALNSAKEAGFEVKKDCLERVQKFFKSCEINQNGRTSYMAGNSGGSDAITGVGMLVHEFLLDQVDSPLVTSAASYLAGVAERQWSDRNRVGVHNYYLWYNCTLAMFQVGGEPWKRWNNVVRDAIIGSQNTDAAACARGSWEVNNSFYGYAGGRVYTTALAVLTLEVYYRYSTERAKVYDATPDPTNATRDGATSQ